MNYIESGRVNKSNLYKVDDVGIKGVYALKKRIHIRLGEKGTKCFIFVSNLNIQSDEAREFYIEVANTQDNRNLARIAEISEIFKQYQFERTELNRVYRYTGSDIEKAVNNILGISNFNKMDYNSLMGIPPKTKRRKKQNVVNTDIDDVKVYFRDYGGKLVAKLEGSNTAILSRYKQRFRSWGFKYDKKAKLYIVCRENGDLGSIARKFSSYFDKKRVQLLELK